MSTFHSFVYSLTMFLQTCLGICNNNTSIFFNNINLLPSSLPYVLTQFNKLKKTKKIFNLKNKINYTKSNHKLGPTNKAGKSRTSLSSSPVLRKGLVWFGFRHLNISNLRFNFKVVSFMFICRRSFTYITTLEIFKLIHELNHNYTSVRGVWDSNIISPVFLSNPLLYNEILKHPTKSLNIVH